jgi:hypothetical protein
VFVCVKSLCLYTFFDPLYLFRPFWEMFCKRQDNSVIHASDMGNYMLHARGSETLQTFTFRLLKGKQRTSVTFQTDGNIPILLHVFASLLIVIHSQCGLLLLARVCFCVSCGPFVHNMTHISLQYISTIYSIPLFCYMIHKIAIRLCHWSSRATPGTPASNS